MSRPQQLDALFHALADTTRRRIVLRLLHGPRSVTELAAPFSISLAAVSKHLDVLEDAGVVHRERDGRFQRCHLNPSALDDAHDFIQHYRSFWQSNLDQLAEYLEDPARSPSSQARKGKRR